MNECTLLHESGAKLWMQNADNHWNEELKWTLIAMNMHLDDCLMIAACTGQTC